MKVESAAPGAANRLPRWATACLALLAATLLSASASAQVVVTATAGDPGPTGYTTLGSAFAAINAGVPQGAITVAITGDTNETTVSAVLNASGTGAASYTSVLVSPSGGAARTVTGATTAGSPLIDLNGADNVTIDGLNTGGNSLTISNTTISATANTSTIRFQADATNNTITNASILGSSTMATTTNGGTLYFGTGTTTGNDNNTISNCNIGPAGANLPAKAVYGNGSTGTTAQMNSGVAFNNNNVFDFFSATVQSNGFFLNAGNTDWIITNNRFFQTATRTQTTGTIHSAIQVASGTGNNNHNISGNTIGFSSAAGTGTYALVGIGVGSKFLPIYFSAAGTTTASSIQGNAITAINLSGVVGGTSTTGAFVGISIASGLANIGTVSGNVVGSLSTPGAISITSNNASAMEVFGIYFFPSALANVSNNSVGGMTMTNSGAGSLVYYGIRAFTTSGVINTMLNNVVGTAAAPISNTSASTASRTIGLYCQSGACLVSGNSIGSLSMNGANTGTGAAASVIGLWIDDTSATLGNNVAQNTVQSLTNTNAVAAVWVTGLHYNGATTGTHTVQRNFIHTLSTPSTSATATVNGINVQAGLTAFQNNMIVLGNDMTANSPQINGINETAAGTDNFFHNSVFIGGSGVAAGTASSFAFQSSIVTNPRSYRDNVLVNARSNGAATSKHYAIRVGGTAPNPAGLTSNNNILLASGTGGLTGLFNAVDQPTLAAWQAATGQDGNSFALDPQYLAPTAVPPDLHINPAMVTVIEGNGADVGVTDDFDGQARSGLTPVDIGADAGNFLGIDLTPPVIAYTPLSNTLSTSNRILPATITDAVSGVPTAGIGLPVIYFRKGTSGAFSSTQASFGGGSSYAFTIDYSLLGGVVVGDTIQYYVVAQDGAATPNVTSNPLAGASGFTPNPPAAATPPTTPNSYLISAAVNGIKTVCASGCDFTTLTGAGGIFNAINVGVATGNIDVQIAGDLTVGEDGTNGLNALGEEPAGSNFSVRIYPTGSPRAVTGAFNGALIRLNGSSRVTIDGSIGGTGTDRSLTIQNTSVTTPTVVLLGSTGTAPITSDSLKNCVIINGANTSSAVVISDAGTLGNAGFFSNVTIQNNDIQRAFVGVFATGGTFPQNGSNLTYAQNTVNTSGANAVRNVGLYMQGVNGATVSQNTVGNIDKTNNENDVGIWLALGTINATVSGNTVATLGYTGTGAFAPIGINVTSGATATNDDVTGNTVSDVSSNGGTAVRGIAVSGTAADLTIQRNKVDGIVNTNTGTFGAYGIDISAGNNIVVKNNFVSNVSFNMTGGAAFSTTFGVFGIRVGSGTGHKVDFNSVNLVGPLAGVPNSSLLSAAFALVSTASTGCDVRDNIFANNITGGTTSIAHVSAYLPSGGTSAMNLTWNNNAYYFGTDALRQGVGQAGTTAGTNFFTTLAALQAYSSTLSPAGTNDNASLASTAAVPFVSASDLHLLPGSLPVAAGTPIAGIPSDIDGDARSAVTPEIGADELLENADLSLTKTDGVVSATPGGSTTYTIVAANAGPDPAGASTVTDTFPPVLSCTWTCAGAGGGTCSAAGAGNINDTVNLPAGGSVTYMATCLIASSATGSLVNTATVAPAASVSDPVPGNNLATDTDTLTPTADLSISKTDGVGSVTPGGSTTYTIVVSNPGPSDAPGNTVSDVFPAFLSCSWTCVGAGGGSCSGGPIAGNISDTANLPAGASATYTASCAVSAGATGSIVNTATVAAGAGVNDPSGANNSATDIDTVVTGGAGGRFREVEPNNTAATANALPSNSVVVLGNVFPNADVDFYSFTANAGDRVYAGIMTSFSANASTDSQLTLIASDGTTQIEFDDDDGSLGSLSSSIAGATIPTAGTYFLKVNHFSLTNQLRPYEMYLRVQSGAPTAEVEPNDTPGTANPLPSGGWVSGTRDPAAATEQDWYSFTANAGDTVFLSLDLDPERDNVQWNGRLGIALFGDAGNQILVVDDASTGSVANPLSEALYMTVKASGTYFAFVDSASAATGGPTATYNLSVTIFPAVDEGVNCTTYTSTDVPQAIGPGAGLVSSTITIPGNPRIADMDVEIQLNHALMADIDAHLRSPQGNDNGLFTDIGAAATGGQTQMDVVFDDEAAIPPLFTVLKGIRIKPELAYRLSWFDGEDAGGTWTLDLRDDLTNASGGTLTSWSIRICEPPPPPACPPGTSPLTVFSTDFEGGASGFTHSGTADEWELGLPATAGTTTANPVAAFTSCNSGVSCWKTDLDNTYDISSSQDLLSPNIDLSGLVGPVVVSWAQRYQVENATFDHVFVDYQQAGGGSPARLFEWRDATMTDAPGNPVVNIGASAGWARMTGRGDSLAGLNTELRFHLDSDTSINFGGLAIDDVTVTACQPVAGASADLSISKTDGVATAVPGGSVTYTITASNAVGPDPAPGATVTDTFPASLTCSWTCLGSGGGTCTAAGAGNISDTVSLPVGGSVTYTANCSIASSATGSLSNTATVAAPAGVTDPVPGNNSATDTDTLGASADVSITKTDGVTTAVPGGSVTYTITASNAGPSDAPGTTAADTFPASLACTWTCVGAGGGTCTASGAGNINDGANLPAGASVTYTASCSIASSATGNLVNTATATTAGGVTDPVPGNNSATDTDSLTPTADLSITKDDGVTTAAPGGSVVYSVVASNPGPSDAPGTTVSDSFPASLTCSWTCAGSGGGTCTASGAGNINDTVNLPAGAAATYTASCSIASSATGNLVNTATVAAGAGVTDPVPGNNSATDTDTLAPTGDLSITKDDGVTTAAPGGSVTYTIVATNPGPSDLALGSVDDSFPPEETCSWTCAGSGGGTCTPGPVSGNIADNVSLPAGSSVTYTAQCTIDVFATGSVSNTAAVNAPGFSDPDPSNNQATDTDTLAATADLAVTKDDGVTSVPPGGSLTYTIVASNLGPSYAQGNPLSDAFPPELTCTWTCTPDGSSGTTCNPGPVSGDINDTPDIFPGGSVAYTASCSVSPTATGTISNLVTIAPGPGVSDPDPSNNSASDVDAVAQTLSIADVTVLEGNSGTTPADFVVSLDAPSSQTVSVDFTTVDGTATAANNDYLALSGTLVFAPGELSKIVSSSVIGDLKFEPDEDYTVVLSNPINAVIADGSGLGTILNDDTPTSSSKDELVHDSRETRSLGLSPARDNPTYFRILQRQQSSYEIVVDATTGDIGSSGPGLDRMDSDGLTVLQSSTSATGGSSQSLRFENAGAADVADQYIRVRSAGCSTDCDPADTYRIRAYDTTYRISRFNNSATQVTVVVIANPTDQPVTGNLWFYSATGALAATQPVSIAPRGAFVLNTAGIVSGAGSATFSNDAAFGSLTGKAVAVEPATGFTFDTAMVARTATTKMVPRDN